jgi:hypothetical protein
MNIREELEQTTQLVAAVDREHLPVEAPATRRGFLGRLVSTLEGVPERRLRTERPSPALAVELDRAA